MEIKHQKSIIKSRIFNAFLMTSLSLVLNACSGPQQEKSIETSTFPQEENDLHSKDNSTKSIEKTPKQQFIDTLSQELGNQPKDQFFYQKITKFINTNAKNYQLPSIDDFLDDPAYAFVKDEVQKMAKIQVDGKKPIYPSEILATQLYLIYITNIYILKDYSLTTLTRKDDIELSTYAPLTQNFPDATGLARVFTTPSLGHLIGGTALPSNTIIVSTSYPYGIEIATANELGNVYAFQHFTSSSIDVVQWWNFADKEIQISGISLMESTSDIPSLQLGLMMHNPCEVLRILNFVINAEQDPTTQQGLTYLVSLNLLNTALHYVPQMEELDQSKRFELRRLVTELKKTKIQGGLYAHKRKELEDFLKQNDDIHQAVFDTYRHLYFGFVHPLHW